jgi:hypothetical protein
VRAGHLDEQGVRERMVGYLLAIAHRLAVETTGLPHVIADHLGVADPVVPSSLRATVESARWEPRGSSRVLRAECSHPAMEVALRDHVAALDALLADLRGRDDPDLAVLASLPGRADADKVRAAEPGGAAAYTAAGTRFRLDEDRVQELLMGRQIYGDSELAVREIYQNALDA